MIKMLKMCQSSWDVGVHILIILIMIALPKKYLLVTQTYTQHIRLSGVKLIKYLRLLIWTKFSFNISSHLPNICRLLFIKKLQNINMIGLKLNLTQLNKNEQIYLRWLGLI